FERRFVIYERCDDITDFRPAFAHDDGVAVLNAGTAHRVATHAEQEGVGTGGDAYGVEIYFYRVGGIRCDGVGETGRDAAADGEAGAMVRAKPWEEKFVAVAFEDAF